jgi:thiamine biosynthesis lipoprotein
VNRQQFLKIVALGGAAGIALGLGLDINEGPHTIKETRLLMGTVVNLTVLSDDRTIARAAIQATFDKMQALENVLSRFIAESQLSRLNREGRISGAHPALLEVVKQSSAISQLSGGAFDISMKPLLDLYQESPGQLPGTAQMMNALTLVDYRKIVVDRQTVTFQQPGMSISVDGIAKGFIVDEGVAVLKEFGFGNVMVEAAGDLIGCGDEASQVPWKIGLQAPRAEIGNLIAAFLIQNQAIATSGDYMQAFTPDFLYHHIIDPRTGYSSPELASVSVIAPTTALADGLATAVMVMGKAGLQLIEALSMCEAYAVTKDSRILKTAGFPVNIGSQT